MRSPTDRALLIAAAGGDETAFTQLYQRYAVRLREYFVRSLQTALDADDLVQQVFVQLLDSSAFRHPRTGPDTLDALLFTIAKNLLRNRVRHEQRRGQREATYQTLTRANSGPLPDADSGPRFAAALAQLPPHQRQCITLRYHHGLSVADIAQLMDCAPGTVKSRLHYGLKKLGSLLKHPAP